MLLGVLPFTARSASADNANADDRLSTPPPSVKRRNSVMAYENQHSNHFHMHTLDNARSPTHLISAFFNAILATALFRCWHILLFYFGWSTMVVMLNERVTSLTFQPTLLTVVGTVLGFVVSYRTTSSFERYNEGRRYWSQIILASRTLARAVWFHVPELPPPTPEDEKENRTEDERRARALIEKKTVINLIEAFAVAVKHYLRGEEGIAYIDLYHLVKFLPSYAFPPGVIPTETEAQANLARAQSYREAASMSIHHGDRGDDKIREASEATATGIETRMEHGFGPAGDVVIVEDDASGARSSVSIEIAPPERESSGDTAYNPAAPADGSTAPPQPHVTLDLPHPTTTSATTTHRSRGFSIRSSLSRSGQRARSHSASSSQRTFRPPKAPRRAPTFIAASDDAVDLLPASMPPKNSVFDVFPFSLFVRLLEKKGKQVEGKKAAKMRAKTVVVERNVPLEISMYLTSYVATLGARNVINVPTNNLLIFTINQLTDALTGLERILTTPIPFSYSIHLWLVTIIYNLALPFQIYPSLRWLTIPASGIVSFIFFGFLVAGEEIENPFGYDKNDLNMDHFTHNIIRNELRAMTAFPPPAPETWAFSPRNDRLFATADPFQASRLNVAALDKDLEKDGSGLGCVTGGGLASAGGGLTPDQWMKRGSAAMRDALARAH